MGRETNQQANAAIKTNAMLRTRLIRSMAFVLIAAFACWFVSRPIYNFLARPVQRALAEAQPQRKATIAGRDGQRSVLSLGSLKQNDQVRFVFPEATRLGQTLIPAGASVMARVDKDAQGNLGLFTDEALSAGNDVVPKDVKLPVDLSKGYDKLPDPNDKLVVTKE